MKINFFSLFVSSLISSTAMSYSNSLDKVNLPTSSGLHSICPRHVAEVALSFIELDGSQVVVITQNGQIDLLNGSLYTFSRPAYYLTIYGSKWDCDYTVASANSEDAISIPWRQQATFKRIMSYSQLMMKLKARTVSALPVSDQHWIIIKRQMLSPHPLSDSYEFISTSDPYRPLNRRH